MTPARRSPGVRGSARLEVRGVGQAEEAADGVEQGVRTGGVVGGRGRAEGAPRVVEELVAEPRHGPCDRRSVGVAQVGAGGEEAVELATERGLGAAAELADHGGGVTAVRRWRRATESPPSTIAGVLSGGSRSIERSC